MTDVFQIRYVSKIKYVSKIYSNKFEGDIEKKKKRKRKSNKFEKHRKAIIYIDLSNVH